MKKKICFKSLRIKIITCVLIFILFNLFFISTVPADKKLNYVLESYDDILPYPLSRGSAVWVGDSIYIFGGRNDTEILDRIMKYTPAEGKLDILETALPTVLMGTTSVYDGRYVYIFGGKDWGLFYDSILRFDPKTETIINMTAKLPNPTVGAAAVWTGKYIYFFGGSWGAVGPHKFDTILRYDPERDNITTMNSTLPYGRSGLAATWDGEYIFIIGGSDGVNYSAEILRYSPENDTLISMPASLPSGRKHTQVEYHDGAIYIFGGRNGSRSQFIVSQILRYSLETNKVEILDQELPRASEFRMHAYDGEKIYIIGGFDSTKMDFNQFIIFNPSGLDGCNCSSCSPENPYEILGIVLLILGVVIIITLMNNYRKKNKI